MAGGPDHGSIRKARNVSHQIGRAPFLGSCRVMFARSFSSVLQLNVTLPKTWLLLKACYLLRVSDPLLWFFPLSLKLQTRCSAAKKLDLGAGHNPAKQQIMMLLTTSPYDDDDTTLLCTRMHLHVRAEIFCTVKVRKTTAGEHGCKKNGLRKYFMRKETHLSELKDSLSWR